MTFAQPDTAVAAREAFGLDTDLVVPAFGEPDEHVPDIDAHYRLNPDVTRALLAGFTRNRRVLVICPNPRHKQRQG